MSYCVAIIPARGGSKGLPGKNIRMLMGKPLIVWSIEMAQSLPDLIQEVWVTTDSKEIEQISTAAGATVWKRPSEISQDLSPVSEAVLNALEQHNHKGGTTPTHFVLLEPTSPLRTREMVSHAIHQITSSSQYNSAASFSPAPVNPHRIWKIVGGEPKTFIDGVDPWLPRQKLPEAFFIDGGVYSVRTDVFRKTGGDFFAPPCSAVLSPPGEIVDIDHEIDFQIAEIKLKKRLFKEPK